MENKESFIAVFYQVLYYTKMEKPSKTIWEICTSGDNHTDNQ